MSGITQVNLTSSLSPGITPNIITLTNGAWSGNIKFNTAGAQTVTASAGSVVYTTGIIVVTNAASGAQNVGSVTIKVTDASGKTAVPNASVKVSCDATLALCATIPSWSGATDANGNVTMPRGTLAQTPFLHVVVTYTDQSSGIQTESFNVAGVATDSYVTRPVALQIDLTHVPVILLPGIMGSTDGKTPKIWSSSLPVEQAQASELDLIDPLGVVGWGNLENDLEKQGYQKGKTIIRCPYDWRMRISDEASTFLSACVTRALAANPQATNVDIIAHSQGGLVTRAYVQGSSANAAKVRKIAFVGTPQYGATDAYFAWEGGDMNDVPTVSLATVKKPSSLLRSKSDTARNIYKTKTGKELPGSALVPDLLVDKCALLGNYSAIAACALLLGVNYESYVSNADMLQAFIQTNVPSIRQLMPTYNFLKNQGGTYTSISSANENEFLKALNGDSCQDGVCNDSLIGGGNQPYSFASFQAVLQNNGISSAVFYDNGSTLDTTKNVSIGQPTSANLYLYVDGTPVKKEKNAVGDETVTAESTELFADANQTSANQIHVYPFSNDSSHPTLIESMRGQIVSFILDSQLSAVSLSATNPTLYVSVNGPVQALLTNPLGHQKGLDSDGVAYDAITGATANIEGGKNDFVVPNPATGNYTLALSGAQAGTVEISIGYNDGAADGKVESKSVRLYHHAGTQIYTFTKSQ